MTPEPERGDDATPPRLVAMVVDDNRALRECTQRLLESAGYETIAFAGGDEALTHAAGAPSLDVVVTDLTMDRMSGLDLLGRLRELRPQLPAIVISGHGDRISEPARTNPEPAGD